MFGIQGRIQGKSLPPRTRDYSSVTTHLPPGSQTLRPPRPPCTPLPERPVDLPPYTRSLFPVLGPDPRPLVVRRRIRPPGLVSTPGPPGENPSCTDRARTDNAESTRRGTGRDSQTSPTVFLPSCVKTSFSSTVTSVGLQTTKPRDESISDSIDDSLWDEVILPDHRLHLFSGGSGSCPPYSTVGVPRTLPAPTPPPRGDMNLRI